jgi:hypothetical protein
MILQSPKGRPVTSTMDSYEAHNLFCETTLPGYLDDELCGVRERRASTSQKPYACIILVIVKQHLVQIGRMDGPTEYSSYMLAAITTKGPMWGHPMLVLGALCSFLEPFCGNLSPKIDKVSGELTLRYPHEGPWVVHRSRRAPPRSGLRRGFRARLDYLDDELRGVRERRAVAKGQARNLLYGS